MAFPAQAALVHIANILATQEKVRQVARDIAARNARGATGSEDWAWLVAGWEVAGIMPPGHVIWLIRVLWPDGGQPPPELLDWFRQGVASQRAGKPEPTTR